MSDSKIIPFPVRTVPEKGTDPGDVLLAKISVALLAMKELHAELDNLKAMLKRETTPPPHV